MTPILQFPSSGKADLSARICKRYSKEISALAGRCFEITMTTNHDVFFEFTAHVKLVEIHNHEGGYNASENNIVRLETYIEAGRDNDKKITKWFKEANKYLDELA